MKIKVNTPFALAMAAMMLLVAPTSGETADQADPDKPMAGKTATPPEDGTKKHAAEKPGTKTIPGKDAPPMQKDDVQMPDNSPFDYGSSDLDEWTPSGAPAMLRGLKVSGIVETEDGSAIAAISATASGRSFFVREGDTIRLDPAEVYGQQGVNPSEEIYLQIKKISGQQVETTLKKRPDKLIILR